MVASKVAGPSAQMTWIRGGPSSLSAKDILQALDSSLSRLGTDYIDLYQLHWPDRSGMIDAHHIQPVTCSFSKGALCEYSVCACNIYNAVTLLRNDIDLALEHWCSLCMRQDITL